MHCWLVEYVALDRCLTIKRVPGRIERKFTRKSTQRKWLMYAGCIEQSFRVLT